MKKENILYVLGMLCLGITAVSFTGAGWFELGFSNLVVVIENTVLLSLGINAWLLLLAVAMGIAIMASRKRQNTAT